MPLLERKRKMSFQVSASTSTPRPAKKPRHTLDSYFSLPVAVAVKNEGDAGDYTISHIALSHEQTKVFRMVVNEGTSVFFTGAAGTGKSLLLKAIINGLRLKYTKHPEYVAITASTAMAASNIGGQTIYAWGAVPPTVDDIDTIIKSIKTCRPALKRWKEAKVLIIDEVSMVDGFLFNRLAQIATRLRKKTPKPFGGLQLVVTGDFFQLPPVTKGNIEPYFAFESSAWEETLECTVNLIKVFRQKDQRLIDALNSLRLGEPSEYAVALFNSQSAPLAKEYLVPSSSQVTADELTSSQYETSQSSQLSQMSQRMLDMTEIVPTELFPLRSAVASANQTRLNALRSKQFTFTSTDTGTKPSMLDSLLAEAVLDLKLGAQVMLIKNVDEVLVNGLVGKVIGFHRSWELWSDTAPDRPPLSANNGGGPSREKKRKNGSLVRHVRLDAETGKPVLRKAEQKAAKKQNPEEENETHVKKEKGKHAPGKPESQTNKENELFPLVLFQYPIPGGIGEVRTEAVLLKRDEFTVEDAEGKVLARRVQIPLILAWAISIHKSQGQTIHRVKVDLTRVFEHGQSYVALSRASSLEGLQVIGFNPKKVMAHRKVIEWNKTLQMVS